MGGICRDKVKGAGESCPSCGVGWGCCQPPRRRAGSGSPAEAGREGQCWAVPGLPQAPPQSSAQAPRRRREDQGQAHLLLLQFIGHLGPCGPSPAPAAPLRLRLCSAALGPLGVSPPPPARCARVEQSPSLQLARTLRNLPDNQAPPPPIGHWSQAASFFSHWKEIVQTARVRLLPLVGERSPALKWVELRRRRRG